MLVIVNGAAGGGRCRARADQAIARLHEAGVEVEVRLTEGPGHATELAADGRERGVTKFLSVGGDGTAYEVINGLFPNDTGDELTLGILPLGTGNSFLRDFGIIGEKVAIEALLRGRTHRVDVVRAEHEGGVFHYMNLLSVGFSAEAGDLTNRRFKKLGAAGYVAAVLASVAKLEHPVIPVRIDGGDTDRRPCVLLSFSNSRYTGGQMMMAPRADVSDGQLDVIRVGGMTRAQLLATFPAIYRGTHVDHPLVEQMRARRVDFEETVERPAMVDGEVLSVALRSLEVVPSALSVIA